MRSRGLRREALEKRKSERIMKGNCGKDESAVELRKMYE